jgi:hypothetical protein
MFRGLRQDDTRVIMFPFAEARIDLYDDDEGLTNVALRIGSWNSLNTGVSGSAGPSGKLWYESRFYSAVDFTLGPGIIVGGGYTAYPSPNNSFSTVKELFFRAGSRAGGRRTGCRHLPRVGHRARRKRVGFCRGVSCARRPQSGRLL